ncbi:helix-turn-helix domain-containing protein [Kurthia senegalensis]|uniref:helix-turn-helix domain-containing protein n=1 Tax=Kurthia senegalensis TaxID=1033740 RepID=UPI000289DB0B|nr:helix-turn-helix transcriptional regulator [Kurthia senegalensis]
MFDAKEFGQQLKSFRETSNHSMLSLAKLIGTSASRIKSWEMGESVPSAKWIVRLSNSLSISTDELLLKCLEEEKTLLPKDLTRSRTALLKDLHETLQALPKQDLMELYVLAEMKQKGLLNKELEPLHA